MGLYGEFRRIPLSESKTGSKRGDIEFGSNNAYYRFFGLVGLFVASLLLLFTIQFQRSIQRVLEAPEVWGHVMIYSLFFATLLYFLLGAALLTLKKAILLSPLPGRNGYLLTRKVTIFGFNWKHNQIPQFKEGDCSIDPSRVHHTQNPLKPEIPVGHWTLTTIKENGESFFLDRSSKKEVLESFLKELKDIKENAPC